VALGWIGGVLKARCRFVTRALLIAVLLCQVEPVRAASLTEMYFAARNQDIAAEAKEDQRTDHACDEACSHVMMARQDRELGDLERQLRRIIGPVGLDGVPREGTISLGSLRRGDMDFGLLDGLAFQSTDQDTRVVVTTPALLKAWLASVDWGQSPRDIDGAAKSEAFYTQGLNRDAAFVRFAELPVPTPPAARLVYAMLLQRAQDFTLGPPDEMVVTVVGRDKVFIVTEHITVPFSRMAACDAIARDFQAKVDAAVKAYDASGLKDQASFDQSLELESDGDIAYRHCFAEHAKEQAAFTAAIAQASHVVGTLPLK
jgi:hypothetical protein